MKIYTKTGDDGTTGLFAGPRVEKDHPRIEAYGAVDELSAVLGFAIAGLLPTQIEIAQRLQGVQSDLFSIGAELATPDPIANKMCLLSQPRVTELEEWIDQLDAKLPVLQNFILPGGSPESALLHLGRTVCRRAERQVVRLSHDSHVSDCSRIIVYLNRLSDLMFVLARFVNAEAGLVETPWQRPT